MDTRRKREGKPEAVTKRQTRAHSSVVLSQRSITPYTLFSEGRKFASVVVDEAHDYRTKSVMWEAVCEAVDRSSVRIAMTATPIVTSPMVSSHSRSAPTVELITSALGSSRTRRDDERSRHRPQSRPSRRLS